MEKTKTPKGQKVWAVIKKEDDPANPGKQVRIAYWSNRPPLNRKQKYSYFTTQEGFEGFCKDNNIITRKI